MILQHILAPLLLPLLFPLTSKVCQDGRETENFITVLKVLLLIYLLNSFPSSDL